LAFFGALAMSFFCYVRNGTPNDCKPFVKVKEDDYAKEEETEDT